MSDWITVTRKIEHEFGRARRQALFHALAGALRRRPTALVPFEAIRARIAIRGQHDLGIQSVPLDYIIGSEGRADDFDRRFLPQSENTKERWKQVVSARYRHVGLPPVELYKLGPVYFVRDGNHRISAARQHGQAEIDAHVVELKTDVSVTPQLDTRDLVHIEEQNDFLEWTNLAQVRRCGAIEVSALGGYLDLIGHINRHRAALAEERGHEVEREEAIADWYDTVYQPVIAIVRQAGLMRHDARMTEGDLFLQVIKQHNTAIAQGRQLTVVEAAEEFVARQRGRRLLPGRTARRLLGRIWPDRTR